MIVKQLDRTEAMIVRLVNTGMTDLEARLEELRRGCKREEAKGRLEEIRREETGAESGREEENEEEKED